MAEKDERDPQPVNPPMARVLTSGVSAASPAPEPALRCFPLTDGVLPSCEAGAARSP